MKIRQLFPITVFCGCNHYEVDVANCDFIWEVADQKLNHLPNRLLCSMATMLDNNKMVADYNLKEDSFLTAVQYLTGGGGIEFVDPTKMNPTTLEWDASAPKWRSCERGLCLEGECSNQHCAAFNKGRTSKWDCLIFNMM